MTTSSLTPRLSSRFSGNFYPVVAVLCVAGLYLAVSIFFGRFPDTDDIYFKSAGRHLAETGVFAAPELAGFMGLEPGLEEVYFAYPPLYTMLFGAFVWVFGFGYVQCVTYDALIHAALIIVTFLLSRRVMSGLPKALSERRSALSVVPVLIVTPLAQHARPDQLAMCFGMLGLYFLVNNSRPVVSGLCSGLCFGLGASTSTAAAIGLGMVGFGLILFENRSFLHKFTFLSALFFSGLIVFLGLISTVLIESPEALSQFFTIAKKFAATGSWLDGLKFGWNFGKATYLVLAACLGTFVCLVMLEHSQLNIGLVARYWSGGILALVFYHLMFTGKYTYFWMIVPWLIIVSVCSLAVLYQSKKRVAHAVGITMSIVFILLSLSAVILANREILIISTLPPEQKYRYNQDLISKLIPPGSTIIAGSHWWSFSSQYLAYDPAFSNTPALASVDYILLSANGSGRPGKPHYPANAQYQNYLRENCVEIRNNLPQEAFGLYGVQLSNSGWGFGFSLFQCRF